MDTKLFKKVNEVLAARFSLSLVVVLVLSVVVMVQAIYINARGEIIIERPMFSMNKEMIYTRNVASRSISEVWAYNAVMLFGNVNKENIGFLETVAYNFIGTDIAGTLKTAHRDLVRFMENNSVVVTFKPNGIIDYDEKKGIVTIQGVREIRSLMDKDQTPKRDLYEYQVGISMSEYSPWVSYWKEGVIREGN